MRFPFCMGLALAALVALKVVAVGSVALGLMVVAPLLLSFAIIAGVFIALVGSGMLVLRFLMWCLRGFRAAPPPMATAAEPARAAAPPRAPMPDPLVRRPDLRYRLTREQRRALYPPRQPSPWAPIAAGMLVLCLVVFMARAHSLSQSRIAARVGDAFARTAERIRAKHTAHGWSWSKSGSTAEPAIITIPGEDPTEFGPPWSETGMGPTAEEATQRALEKAREKLIAYLRAQTPPIRWVPRTEDMNQLVHVRPEDQVKDMGRDLGLLHEVRVRVSLTDDDRARILRLDHHEQMEDRVWFTLLGLAGIVAVLTAVAGYIRLDEWSKGYYTGWLRAAVIGVVAAAGAGIWFLAS